MAKARAILKRRKAVRNIKKITKTMQMIATAKFQKSLKRAVGTKPYTLKVRELVAEVARNAGDVDHPLLRPSNSNRAAVVVITSNRGLCGAYNGNVIRRAVAFIRSQQKAGTELDVYTAGKKGATVLKFQKIPTVESMKISDTPSYSEVEPYVRKFIEQFVEGKIGALHLVYMNFVSTGVQKPEVMTLLPLSSLAQAADRMAQDLAEKEAQLKAGSMDAKRTGADVRVGGVALDRKSIYEFSPAPRELLDELLPLTVKTAFFQAFLDATTSEHVARMVAMKAATDAADKMARSLTLEANRARQTQITTELSEIMGGVEAMKGK
jgi:F-type H+-transporting ATPase subunit gamma